MSEIPRPSTPADRITTVNIRNPPAIDPTNNEGPLATPVSAGNMPETANPLFTSPLESPPTLTLPNDCSRNSFSYDADHNQPDEAELLVTWYLSEFDKDPQAAERIPPAELKRVLTKCQAALRHYRFQSSLSKLHNEECEKRNAVEADLIKKQVDFLLQSPFALKPRPSQDRRFIPSRSPVDEREMTPRTAISRATSRRISKPELKLVERFQYKQAASTTTGNSTKRDFSDHIKVFSLEKKKD